MYAHTISVDPRDIDHMGHVNNAVYCVGCRTP